MVDHGWNGRMRQYEIFKKQSSSRPHLIHDRIYKFEEIQEIRDATSRRLLMLIKGVLAMSNPKWTNTIRYHVNIILYPSIMTMIPKPKQGGASRKVTLDEINHYYSKRKKTNTEENKQTRIQRAKGQRHLYIYLLLM